MQGSSVAESERRGSDVIVAAAAAAAALRRADAFDALAHLVAPPDALLLQLLSGPAAAQPEAVTPMGGQGSSQADASLGFGALLRQEALAAAAAIFGAAGVRRNTLPSSFVPGNTSGRTLAMQPAGRTNQVIVALPAGLWLPQCWTFRF